MKRCNTCGYSKPYAEFSPNAHMRDGHLNICKPCNAAKARTRRGRPRQPFQVSFWTRVGEPDANGCRVWTGATAGGDPGAPYGLTWNGERPEMAHRVAYRLAGGEIPDGMQIDHLCRVRLCVNPEHLEPVTAAENLRRRYRDAPATHCPNGHEYTPESTRIEPDGGRRCRVCLRATYKRGREKGTTP